MIEPTSEPKKPAAVVLDPPIREPKKPALTIVIQSWATPIFSALMLVLGLLGGYFLRPWLEDKLNPIPTRTAAQEVTQPTAAAVDTGVTIPQVNSAEELMDYLVSQAVHFKGDENAPVTMIEFSDFQ
jgi:hypothetical protein